MLCAEILWSSMRQNLPPGERSRLLCCLMHKVVPTGEGRGLGGGGRGGAWEMGGGAGLLPEHVLLPLPSLSKMA